MSETAVWLSETCQGLGPVLGPAYYVGFLSVWVVLCLPTSPIELLPGFLFGLRLGAACSVLGKLLGSALAMGLGRYVFKAPTERYIYSRFPKIRKLGVAVEREGFPLLLFIRGMWAPIAFKNYGLAVTNVSIPMVLLAGTITSVPHSLAFAYMGTKLGSLVDVKGRDQSVWKLLLGDEYEELWLLVLVGLPVVLACAVVFRNFYVRFASLLRE